MKSKTVFLITLGILMIIFFSACSSEMQLDNSVGLRKDGNESTFEFRTLKFAVPGTDWKHSKTSGDEPIIIDYRSKTVGGINIIGFSNDKSNYKFLEESYKKHEDVQAMFNESSDAQGMTSQVSCCEVKGHNVYFADMAVEESEENGKQIYDFVVSTKMGDNNYCDVFFFLNADSENDYIKLKEKIVESMDFASETGE